MKRCIVTDLDGTLVKTAMVGVSQRTVDLIIRLQKAGMLFVLASGRPLSMMYALGETLKLDQYGGYLIGHNGYEVYDYKLKSVSVSDTYLEQDVIDYVYDYATKHLSYLTLVTKRTSYSFGTRLVRRIKKLYFYIRLRRSAHGFLREYEDINTVDEVKEPVYKIGFATYSKRTLINLHGLMKEKFGDAVEVVRVNPRYIDIVPCGISKGLALMDILTREGIDAEDAIAFGDAENDISMLKVVGTAVAMENAMDEVKDISDDITESNTNDGVYHYLKRSFGHLDE